jgi:Spy/CpxP family protein refolding chaperone
MLHRVLRSLGLALVLASFVCAQPPVAWWENPVGAGLSLTDAQRDRINGIARDYRDRLVQKRAEANRAERELEDIFNADVVDMQRGNTAIDRLARARADLTQDVSRMTLQMRTVLTGEQWRALQSRRDANKSKNGRGKGSSGRGTAPSSSGSGLLPSR